MLAARKSQSEKTYAALVQLRRRLVQKGTLEPNLLNSDVFLKRYLWDTHHNVDTAERMLECYARTRKESDIDDIMTSISPPEIYENFLCFLGATDHDNRPVLQLPCTKNCDLKKCIENGFSVSFEAYFMKIHWTVEKMMLENNADFAVLIVDLKEICYTQFLHHKSFMAIMNAVQRIQKFSPGTVQRAIVVNAPRILKILLAAARKLITINAEVIVFAENQANWREKLQEYVPREQLCPAFGGTSTSCYAVK